MVPESFRKIGVDEERFSEIEEFLEQMLQRAAEQGITCCFEATGGICDFQFVPCCRSCLKPDVVKVEDDPAMYYCSNCVMPIRLSLAMYCPECGFCDFLATRLEDIMGASEEFLKREEEITG